MKLVGFDASVKSIIQHRNANKAIRIKHQLSTDYDDVANELESYTRLRLGIPSASPPSFFRQSRNSPQSGGVAAAGTNWLRRFSQIGTGIATISDLKRSGRDPVIPEVAEKRASICLDCPKNLPGDLFSVFTKPIANLVRHQIEDKTKLNLKTSKDEKLNVCDACGCPIQLKLWFPLDVIKAHIKQPELEQLDPRCWILKGK